MDAENKLCNVTPAATENPENLIGAAPAAEAPAVSVVIPSYNHALYIRETIESVLGQTFEDLELIIIDDGSQDASVEVIENTISEWAHKNVVFVHRENRGLCRTLNEGLRIARGEYFAYLGSDDLWAPEKLSKQIGALDAGGAEHGACFCDCSIIDSEGKLKGRIGSQYPFRGGMIYDDLIWMRFQPSSPTNLFRKEAVVKVGGFDETHSIEDRDLWIRVAREYRIAYVDEPLASWRVHNRNTSKNLEAMYEYAIDVLDRAIVENPELRRHEKTLRAKIDAQQAANYFENNDMESARKYSIRALVRNPTYYQGWRALLLSTLGPRIVSRMRAFRRSSLG